MVLVAALALEGDPERDVLLVTCRSFGRDRAAIFDDRGVRYVDAPQDRESSAFLLFEPSDRSWVYLSIASNLVKKTDQGATVLVNLPNAVKVDYSPTLSMGVYATTTQLWLIRRWEGKWVSRRLMKFDPSSPGVLAVAISPDGRQAAITTATGPVFHSTGAHEARTTLISTDHPSVRKTVRGGWPEWSADGRWSVCIQGYQADGSRAGYAVELRDAVTGRSTTPVSLGISRIRAAAVSPDGRRVFIALAGDQDRDRMTIERIDLATGRRSVTPLDVESFAGYARLRVLDRGWAR